MISLPANYVLLQRIELNASAASVTFSNIPQSGYTDLKIVVSARSTRTTGGTDNLRMEINGSATNFSYRNLEGNGSTVVSDTGTTTIVGFLPQDGGTTGWTANTFASTDIYIPNYTSSTNKSFSVDTTTENNATTSYSNLLAHLWSQTTAISSLTFKTGSGSNFVAYSTFSLYGLAAVGTTPVIAPKATGGNITSDGTYWIHTFNSTGTFTPLQGLSCDYLVVAGGGGGGSDDNGGGGGAGGLRSTVTATGGGGSLESALSVASGTAYTVTVGAGGANTVSGSNSVFSTITATGGGNGASNNINASNGGSGGGGGTAGNRTTAGSGTANQGYAGNTVAATVAPAYGSGGGGGAGAIGVRATSTTGGNGGAGVAISISGSSVTYAGGGGGGSDSPYAAGTGGSGGGGAGSATGAGTAGTANTGGGGGGAAISSNAGGAGGSGIVIIRYPIA